MTQQTSTSPTPPVPPAPAGAASDDSQPTIGELVARISDHVTGLVKGEIELAKAKGKRMAKSLGLAVGLLAAAGVLALYALGMLLDAAAHGIGEGLPLWAGYLIVGVVLLIICGVLALVAKGRLDAAKKDTPKPQEGLKQDVSTVKVAASAGLEKGGQE